MTIFQFVGNTMPSFGAPIRQNVGGVAVPVDLTNATVNLRVRSRFGGTVLIDDPAVITDAPGGIVRYDWSLANVTTDIGSMPGPYVAWWHITLQGGAEADSPEFDLEFLDHSPRRSVGPCTDWCSGADVRACYSEVELDSCLASATRMASEVLFEMSGRQFPGWCQSVIRPCADGGACFGCMQVLDRGHVLWSGGRWESGGEPCGCGGHLPSVTLPGVAQGIVEVLVGGIVVPSTEYRLDPDNKLIRLAGFWPLCQNMVAPATAPGTFQVTYAHGYAPPEVGRRAAAQLAREFWLACNGRACKLPSGVVQLVRQGITITRAASLFKDGASGLAMVDAFLATYGQQPTVLVMSPDTYPTDRRIS